MYLASASANLERTDPWDASPASLLAQIRQVRIVSYCVSWFFCRCLSEALFRDDLEREDFGTSPKNAMRLVGSRWMCSDITDACKLVQ